MKLKLSAFLILMVVIVTKAIPTLEIVNTFADSSLSYINEEMNDFSNALNARLNEFCGHLNAQLARYFFRGLPVSRLLFRIGPHNNHGTTTLEKVESCFDAIADAGARYYPEMAGQRRMSVVVEVLTSEAFDGALAHLMAVPHAYLKVVQFSAGNVLAPGSHDSIALLARLLRNNRDLHSVHLQGNQIDDRQMVMLADALESNQSVQQVDLSQNLIGDQGARALVPELKNHPSLRQLDLSQNPISSSGRHALLADSMKSNRLSELRLDLSWNGDREDAQVFRIVLAKH